MVIVSVLYPAIESGFNHDYYLQTHVPLVKSRWMPMGLTNVELMRGAATLDGATIPFELIGLLTFASMEQMQSALSAHGAEIIGDIPNFTAATPQIQINDAIAS
jgi:uncharacterized protein (TIGR02118 family)